MITGCARKLVIRTINHLRNSPIELWRLDGVVAWLPQGYLIAYAAVSADMMGDELTSQILIIRLLLDDMFICLIQLRVKAVI